MHILTDIIKWVAVHVLNQGGPQYAAIVSEDGHQPRLTMVTANRPRLQRRTFAEYSPLELQKIIDLAG